VRRSAVRKRTGAGWAGDPSALPGCPHRGRPSWDGGRLPAGYALRACAAAWRRRAGRSHRRQLHQSSWRHSVAWSASD